MEQLEVFKNPRYQKQDLKVKQELANEYFDKYYANNKLYTSLSDENQKKLKQKFSDDQIDFDLSDTLDKARNAVGLHKVVEPTADDLKPETNSVDLTPKNLQDPLHTMPQTKEEALQQTAKFLKQEKEDKNRKDFAQANPNGLEDTSLDFAFPLAGKVRAVGGVGAKALAKTPEEIAQAEKVIAGGNAFAAGDVAGNVAGTVAMNTVDASMDDKFKEEHPLLSGLLVMGAGVVTGGIAGVHSEKQVMKRYAKLVDGVKSGKVKPQDAETILKEDVQDGKLDPQDVKPPEPQPQEPQTQENAPFNMDEFLAKTKEPKLTQLDEEFAPVHKGFEDLKAEMDGSQEPQATDTKPTIGEPEPEPNIDDKKTPVIEKPVVGEPEPEAKAVEKTPQEVGDALLQHPRAKELLNLRENVTAKESKSPQVLVQKGAGRELDGYGGEDKHPYDKAVYERNSNNDFELTKKDVKDIRAGKYTEDNLAKLETDLGTLDNHPDYAEPQVKAQEPKEMSKADWKEANSVFAHGIDNVVVGAYAGVDTDENGNVTFDPEKFVLGLGGYTAVKYALKNKDVQGKLKEYAQKAIDTIDMNPAVYKENGLNAMFVGSKPHEVGAFSDVATKKSMKEIDDSGAKIIATPLELNKKQDKIHWDNLTSIRKQYDNGVFNKKEAMKLFEDTKNKMSSGGSVGTHYLSEVLDHPKLFKKYPKLGDTNVSFIEMPKNTEGMYDAKNNVIIISANSTPKELKSTLLHEIQHAIQNKEGFARGGSVDEFKPKQLAETLKEKYGNLPAFDKIERDFLNGKIKTEDEMYSKIINTASENYGGIDKLKFDTYQRLHGEQQARATQLRADMTPEQRASENWQDTLKKIEGNYVEPIVKFDGGLQEQSINMGKNSDTSIEGEVTYIKDHGSVDGTSSSRVTSPDQSTGSLKSIIPKLYSKFKAGKLKDVDGLPDETKLELVQRKMQDRFNRVAKLINTKADINKIDDALNPYQAEENMHGIAAKKIENFEENTFNPIIEKISRGKVFQGTKDERAMTTDDVNLYLWARHAPERNAKMLEKRLEDIPKSAMSDEEANSILQKYEGTEIKDVVKALKKDENALLGRFTKEQVSDYVNAVEAKKINAKIAKVKKESSALSGMSNEEAAKILERYSTSKDIQKVASAVYKMNRDRLQYIAKEGIESKEFIKAIEDNYDNYVPLRREFADGDSFAKSAKGFDVNGKEFKKAKGSQRKVESPLLHSAIAYQETIMRAEKNKVGVAFYNFAKEFPDEKLYSIKDTKATPRVDETTGAVTTESATTKLKDDVLHVKIDGKIKEIIIHDKPLAIAMKNLNSEQLNSIMTSMAKVNRFVAGMSTQYNPAFTVSNFVRDIQTAMFNLPSDIKGSKLRILKDVFPAMKAIYKQNRGHNAGVKDEWQKTFYEMKSAGGTTGWSEAYSVPNLKASTKTMIEKNQGKFLPKQGFKAVLNFIGDANDAVENSTRLVAYKMARESDMTKAKSASIAKNLTVNFNRKGEFGGSMNAFYMFYNASIQGSAQLVKVLKNNPKGSVGVVTGLAGFGFGLDAYNRSQNAEAYALVPQYVKDTNYVIMNDDGTYETVKLPYGYNVFKSMGDIAASLAHGELTLEDLPSRLLSVSVNAFSPIGVDASDPIHTITPTIIKPFYEIYTNKNFFGGNIAPNQNPFAPDGPDSSNYFKSVNPVAKYTAQGLNSITGGTLNESGWIDVSPESIEHIMDFAVGGLGKLIGHTITTVDSVTSGKDVDMNKVPFSRIFYQTPREKVEVSKVYAMYEKSGKHHFSELEKARFERWATEAKRKKDLDPKQYRKIMLTFRSNQKVLAFEEKWKIGTHEDFANNLAAKREADRVLTFRERKKILEK